jgi:hypothetical protein
MSALRLALALILGIEAWVLLGFGIALVGLPWVPASLLLAAAGATGVAVGVARALRSLDGAPASGSPPWFIAASRLLLLGAVAVFLWKLIRVPLWSWDHFAMWGVKARHLVDSGGHLSLGFLSEPSFLFSRPDYPLALPVLWRLSVLGGEPGIVVFKGVHTLLALALVALVGGGIRRLGAAAGIGEVLAAWVAVSPLLWDTVNVGLADLPLALWATAALVLGLLARDLPPFASQAAGLAAGFLPWIKDEGLPLTGLLLVFFALQADRTRWRKFATFACTLALLGRLFAHLALPTGTGFFAGDWAQRGWLRLSLLPRLLLQIGEVLADPVWLGFWLVLAAILVAAGLRSRWRTIAVAGVVALQLALYVGVVLVATPEPLEHVRASALRFAGALLPLGMIGLGFWLNEEK